MVLQAIPTEYHGYTFRSRLEARWALFFEKGKIPFDYEPEGYQYDDLTRYLPDFILPTFQVFAEVKGQFKEWKADMKRILRFVTPELNARGILLLTEVPAPRGVNHTSVYWYPFLYYNPLKECAEITKVVFVEGENGLVLNTKSVISDWHKQNAYEFLDTGSYEDLLPTPDNLIWQTRFGPKEYPVRYSDYQTPLLDDAVGKARRADFSD